MQTRNGNRVHHGQPLETLRFAHTYGA